MENGFVTENHVYVLLHCRARQEDEMTRLTFCRFMDYEDGKMAGMLTSGEMEIPVNIFIDNADEFKDAKKGECFMDICVVGSNIEIYSSEEEYEAAGSMMAVPSMIPMGTFSVDPENEDFEESPHILFTGRILDVEWNPDALDGEANCRLLIETLELIINLYMEYNAPVEKGFIVHGVAWLFGDMHMESSGE